MFINDTMPIASKLSLAFTLIAAALALPLGAAPIKHAFIAIDEGKGNLFHIDENQPAKNWLVHVTQPTPRDMQLVGGGRLLISHDTGFSEYDIATGKLEKEVTLFKGVTSARRLPNGHTLLTGVDLHGEKGVVVL